MKGFLERRGEAWHLRVYLGRDRVTGKQRYTTRTVHGTKREAQRVLAELVVLANRGQLAQTSATVGQLLEAWFEHAAGDFSPKTVKETRGIIDRYLLPALAELRLTKLKASDLDRFYRKLLASGGASARPLAPATVRRIHVVLRRALAQGVKWGWLGVNPAASATPPRVPQTEITPPSTFDLARVLARAASESPELECFLVLAAATGARRSELVALRRGDIDLAGGTVRIAHGIVAGPHGLVEKDTKTHAARRVALDDRTALLVGEQLDRMADRAAMCRTEIGENSFLFSHEPDCSEPWYPDSVSRSFKRLCMAEQLADVRLHDLRHFVASQLLTAGVDVRTVAGRLGHRNAATTLNVYAHFLEQADRGAADVIGNVIARDRRDGPRPRPSDAIR